MKIPKIPKINKKIALIVGIGVFVIALGGVYTVYSKKATEQKDLKAQLADRQTRLNAVKLEPLSARQAELEKQLSEVMPQMETARAKLSQPGGSVNVTTILFALAKDHDVVVNEVTSLEPAAGDLEGVAFSVLPVTAKVEGEVPDLTAFFIKLNSYFTTGVINSVSMNVTAEVTLELTDIPQVFFDLASGRNVEVTEVTYPDQITADLEEDTPAVPLITATVKGKLSDLVAFITEMSAYSAMGVAEVLTRGNASAQVQWTVYTYQGG